MRNHEYFPDKFHLLVQTMFSSLSSRDFRYLWIGQCIALVGAWMQRTALVWLVYELTDSPFMVGLIGVFQFTPMFLFTLPAGVIVDRVKSKRNLLLITNFFFMLQALIMTILTYSNQINYYHIFILSAMYGLLMTFDMPARQAYFPELVGVDKVMNAVSLNSTIFNLAKIIGPALAGIVMVEWGTSFCFLTNTITYFAVIIGLFMIHTPPKPHQPSRQNIRQEMQEGLSYIWHNNTLKVNVLFMATIVTFSMNNDVVTPIFAKEILHRGSDAYSMLMSTTGLGAFLGAIYMSYRAVHGVNKKLFIASIFVMTGTQISLFFLRSYEYALLATMVIGFCIIVFLNMSNSIFQLTAEVKYRGRVMSVYSFLNGGSAPIGSFYAGSVMQSLGGAFGWPGCGLMALLLLGGAFFHYKTAFLRWYLKDI
jgi:MFS family permease